MRSHLMALVRRYWLISVVLVGLVYSAAYIKQQLALVDSAWRIDWPPLLAGALVQVGSWIFLSYLWRSLLRATSGHDVRLADSFFQLSVMWIGKYVPGKVWGILARGSLLMQQHGIKANDVVRATVYEMFFLAYAAAIVLALCGIVLLPAPWSKWSAAGAVTAAVLAPCAWTLFIRSLNGLRGLLPERFRAAPTGLDIEAGRCRGYVLAFVAVWVLAGAVLFGLALGFFPLQVSLGLLALAIAAVTAGYAAGFAAVFAPGGIGVREAVGAAVLALQLPLGDAFLLTVLFRLWTVAAEVAAAGGGWLLVRNRATR